MVGLEQPLSCRWEHVPGSVMEIGKYKSLGFKMPGFWGRRGSCNLQSDLNCLRPSEMYKTEVTMVVSWGPETVKGLNHVKILCKGFTLL